MNLGNPKNKEPHQRDICVFKTNGKKCWYASGIGNLCRWHILSNVKTDEAVIDDSRDLHNRSSYYDPRFVTPCLKQKVEE